MEDWFRKADPTTIVPSTGTRSPSLTMTTSFGHQSPHVDLDLLSASPDEGQLGRRLLEQRDGLPSPVHGVGLDVLGEEHEEGDDHGDGELPHEQRREDGDGHRDLHVDAAVPEREEGLLVDRITPEEGRRDGDGVERKELAPDPEAAGDRREGHDESRTRSVLVFPCSSGLSPSS